MGVLWFEFLVVHKEFLTDTVIAVNLQQLQGLTTRAPCSYTAPAVLRSGHKQGVLTTCEAELCGQVAMLQNGGLAACQGIAFHLARRKLLTTQCCKFQVKIMQTVT